MKTEEEHGSGGGNHISSIISEVTGKFKPINLFLLAPNKSFSH